jgi:hypothetical protein
MSLMTYEEAFPWAESIRGELVAGRMPPAAADPSFGLIKDNRRLTARETDVILTWATGGNPRGAAEMTLPAVARDDAWPLGSPDRTLALPEPAVLPSDAMENTKEFTWNLGPASGWIRAVDLRPGTPSIVRSVVIFLKDARENAEALAPERILARWFSGQAPGTADTPAAFYLPQTRRLSRVFDTRRPGSTKGSG